MILDGFGDGRGGVLGGDWAGFSGILSALGVGAGALGMGGNGFQCQGQGAGDGWEGLSLLG